MPSPGRPKKEAPANPDTSKDPITTPHKEPGPLKDDPAAAETVERAQEQDRNAEADPLSDLPEPSDEPATENSAEMATAPKMYSYENAPTGFGPNSRLTLPNERR